MLDFDDLAPGRMPFPVENFDDVTDAQAAHPAQVPGLVGSQTKLAILRKIGAIKPSGHACSPGLAKDWASSYPIVGVERDATGDEDQRSVLIR